MPNISSLYYRYLIIKQIPIFNKLSWFELQKIARKSVITQYKKGDAICKQGDPPDAFYCLIAGRIRAYAKNKDDEICDVELITRGMFFGIISLLTGENHSLSFEVINDSNILKITKEDFLSILDDIPQLAIDLSKSLSRRIRSRISQNKSVFESTTIATYSPSLSSGCSTYSANLAFNLAQETDKKVIYVNVSDSLENSEINNLDDKFTSSPIWKTKSISVKTIYNDYDKIIQSVYHNNLDIDLIHISFDSEDDNSDEQINQLIAALTNTYSYVVIQLSIKTPLIILKTLVQADIAQIITKEKTSDLKIVKDLIENIKQELNEKFNRENLQILISGYDSTHKQSFEQINNTIKYDVYTRLPFFRENDFSKVIDCEKLFINIPSEKCNYSKAIKKMARQLSKTMVGLVLGGGAALGLAHIGVLKILEEEDIPVDIVVGSSMGALLASFWVTGKSADEIDILAHKFEKQK